MPRVVPLIERGRSAPGSALGGYLYRAGTHLAAAKDSVSEGFDDKGTYHADRNYQPSHG